MKRGPIIHGALLVAALAFAYQTWTRPKEVKKPRGDVVLWDGKPADIVAVEYTTERKTVRVERRDDYLWGVVTRVTTKPKKKDEPPAPDAPEPPGEELHPEPAPPEPVPPAEPEPPPEEETVTNEFPVGDAGTELLDGLLPMRMLRDLGTPSEEQLKEYALEAADTQLTVHLASGSKTLLIGGRVFGGSDRYVHDPESGKVYVMPGETLRPLEGGDQSLRERTIVPGKEGEVKAATLVTPGGERKLVRGEKDGPHGRKDPTWAYADTPEAPDQTLANFMGRVERLVPSEFLPDEKTDTMTSVLRIDYAGEGGAPLGSLELFRRPGEKEGEMDYFVVSARTRVVAKVHRLSAEKIDKDLESLFAPAE